MNGSMEGVAPLPAVRNALFEEIVMSGPRHRRVLCVPAFLLVIGVLAGCGQTTAELLEPAEAAPLEAVEWMDGADSDVLVASDDTGFVMAAGDTLGVSLAASDGLGATVFQPTEGISLAQMFAAVEIAFATPASGGQFHFATVESDTIR